ncbi:MAG: hypothetical protein ACR2GY_09265 [Phycisphaerales bacterium]
MLAWTVFALLSTGCAAKLPTYAWRGPDAALDIISERVGSIETYSARGVLRLERAGDGPIVLDAIVIGNAAGDLRLQASKFDRTVFDLIVRTDGQWLRLSPQIENDEMFHSLTDDAERSIFSPLWWLGGALDREALIVVRATDHTFTVRQPILPNTGDLEATIDKASCTIRRFAFFDEDHNKQQEIVLERYIVINEVVWPIEMHGSGDEGQLWLRFDSVVLNEAHPHRAFEPTAVMKKIAPAGFK